MTTSPVRSRLRGAAAAGISLSIAAFGLAAVAPSANAAATVSYPCRGFGPPFALEVLLDTNAPAKMYVGEKVDIVAKADTALPATLAKSAYDLDGKRSFDGTVTATATVGTTNLDVPHAVPRTTIPDQATATAVPFTATSGALPFTAATPGRVDIKVGDLAAALTFYDGAGANPTVVNLTCAAPPGQPALVDSIVVVARTTTSLTLTKTVSQYGEDVTATAKVVGAGAAVGANDGDVAFSVDGKVTSAKVDKDGVASLVLPDSVVGAHSVTAAFVPKDPNRFEASTSASQAWTVGKARTKIRVPVTGKRTTTATKVGVKAAGAFDTVPTGKVKIKIKRVGKAGRWVKVRKLSDTGSATAGFGKLKAGRYRVVVKYRGDTNHQAKTRTKTFRVKRG